MICVSQYDRYSCYQTILSNTYTDNVLMFITEARRYIHGKHYCD